MNCHHGVVIYIMYLLFVFIFQFIFLCTESFQFICENSTLGKSGGLVDTVGSPRMGSYVF